jgi:hypothetical protein
MGEEQALWEPVVTLPATEQCYYTAVAPTHCDSTVADTCWNYFYVSAHAGALRPWFRSPVVRAYSKSNISRGNKDEGVLTNNLTGAVIEWSLPGSTPAEVTVFDVRGRSIRTMLAGALQDAGNRVAWDGCDDNGRRVPPGIYFVRLKAGDQAATHKVVLLR